MGRVRKQPAKPLTASKDPPPKRKRGRPCKKKLASPRQGKEKVAKCCVCLDTTRYRKMKSLQCSHSFHEQCINKWLEANKKCPVCRMSLGQEKAKKVEHEANHHDDTDSGSHFDDDTDSDIPLDPFIVFTFTMRFFSNFLNRSAGENHQM